MGTHSFDERAATWDDDPAKVERARVVADAIRSALPLRGDMRLLEYGAGTGLVTQHLQDAVGQVTLADSSRGMLEVLHAKVASGALADARVVECDLARDPPPADRFDVVVSVMTLHHIPDLDRALRGLAAVLRPGGHLAVADLEEEDGSFHDEAFEGHHGFARERLAGDLARAGFGPAAFERVHHVVRNGREYGLFLATCTRAGAAP